MFLLRRPSPQSLAATLAGLSGAALTYPEAGATEAVATATAGAADAALPAGYHHDRLSARVGEGDAAWAAAVDGIRAWRMHRGQGFTVVPAAPPIAPGTDVLSAIPLPLPPAHVLAACRVVWVVDEADRYGFGYGTLPLHPSTGEEAFVVRRAGDGGVDLHVTAFSRPHHPLVRLGGPVARRQQARAARGYADALRSHVAAAPGTGERR